MQINLSSLFQKRVHVTKKLIHSVWLDVFRGSGGVGWSPYEHTPRIYSMHTDDTRAVIKRRGPGISPGYYERGPRLLL